MTKNILVPLAEGFEEVEATTIIDVLRRAGAEVFPVGVSSEPVQGAHAITLLTEKTLAEVKYDLFDAIILPGGMPGTTNLMESPELADIILLHHKKNRLIGAICAAPWVLSKIGILNNKKATIYPGMEGKFEQSVIHSTKTTCVSDNIITSKGPGTAIEFALTIISILFGTDKKNKISSELLY